MKLKRVMADARAKRMAKPRCWRRNLEQTKPNIDEDPMPVKRIAYTLGPDLRP
jgi:hypothetical protein